MATAGSSRFADIMNAKAIGMLVILLCSSPVDWTPLDLGDSSFGVISFWPFILFVRFSQPVYWDDLPFPPPVDHLLSELSAMTSPSWVALHGMAYSFIEVCKPFCHNKAVIHDTL